MRGSEEQSYLRKGETSFGVWLSLARALRSGRTCCRYRLSLVAWESDNLQGDLQTLSLSNAYAIARKCIGVPTAGVTLGVTLERAKQNTEAVSAIAIVDANRFGVVFCCEPQKRP